MSWRDIELHGALAIERVCGVYHLFDQRVPDGNFKIKVLEGASGGFTAVVNVCVRRPDGQPAWLSGLGPSELAALEDALKWFMHALDQRREWAPEDFEWRDPIHF